MGPTSLFYNQNTHVENKHETHKGKNMITIELYQGFNSTKWWVKINISVDESPAMSFDTYEQAYRVFEYTHNLVDRLVKKYVLY